MSKKQWMSEDYLRAAKKILEDHKTHRYNKDGVLVVPAKSKKQKRV